MSLPEVNSGVKQGCILSPTLFFNFIDDLVDSLKSVHAGVACGNTLILYADDIVILAPKESDLDKLIKVVESWCHRWNMNLNITKTKVVHFRRKRGNKPKTSHKFFNIDPIDISRQYKYVEITLTEHLEWDKALSEICNKANRALALLNHRTRACGGFAENTYSLLFRQLIESIRPLQVVIRFLVRRPHQYFNTPDLAIISVGYMRMDDRRPGTMVGTMQ